MTNQLFLKIIDIKCRQCKFRMRFKVSMIDKQGNRHEETVITNNEEETKRDMLGFNPDLKLLQTNRVYK